MSKGLPRPRCGRAVFGSIIAIPSSQTLSRDNPRPSIGASKSTASPPPSVPGSWSVCVGGQCDPALKVWAPYAASWLSRYQASSKDGRVGARTPTQLPTHLYQLDLEVPAQLSCNPRGGPWSPGPQLGAAVCPHQAPIKQQSLTSAHGKIIP